MGIEEISGRHAAGRMIMPTANSRLLEFAQESGQYRRARPAAPSRTDAPRDPAPMSGGRAHRLAMDKATESGAVINNKYDSSVDLPFGSCDDPGHHIGSRKSAKIEFVKFGDIVDSFQESQPRVFPSFDQIDRLSIRERATHLVC